MSAIEIGLVVIAGLLVALFLGGLAGARRRARALEPRFAADVADADRALERARAADRGWDRTVLEELATRAVASHDPGFSLREVHLTLVEDLPGVEQDRARLVAVDDHDGRLAVLVTRSGGEWAVERVEPAPRS